MEDLQIFFKYIWMSTVAFIGATVGFITKISPTLRGQALKSKITAYILGIITSMFVAYIVYEISIYFIHDERLSVAFAGLASFSGTDLLVTLQQKLLEVVKRKLDKI